MLEIEKHILGVLLEEVEEGAEELAHLLVAGALALKQRRLLLPILLGLHLIDERADELDLVHLRLDDFVDYLGVALQDALFLPAQSGYYLLVVLPQAGNVLFVMQLHLDAFLFLQAQLGLQQLLLACLPPIVQHRQLALL